MMSAFGHDDGRNGVFEDQLFLIIGFQYDRILVERPYAAREFDYP